MEHKAVLKGMKFFAIIFVAVSIIELIFALLISLTSVNINGETVLLATILMGAEILPLEGAFFWIFLILLICCFLGLGLVLFKLSLAKNLETKSLTKYLSILGMLILIMTFIKIEYLVLLEKTIVNYATGSNPSTFQSFLYNPNITPFSAAAFWIFFMSVACGYLLIGLIVAAGGLKWQLEIERGETPESSKA